MISAKDKAWAALVAASKALAAAVDLDGGSARVEAQWALKQARLDYAHAARPDQGFRADELRWWKERESDVRLYGLDPSE